MANEKNLKKGNPDTQFKSGRKAVENGRKGGIASGISKRETKAFHELAENILSAKTKNKDLIALAENYGVKNPDNKQMVIIGLLVSAINGNHNAFDRFMELCGEKSQSSDDATKQEELMNAIKKAVQDED